MKFTTDIIKRSFYCLLLLVIQTTVDAQTDVKVSKIWDDAPHNAFPDLFKSKKYYYATFREGTNHVGDENDGTVRLMRSGNLKNWETVTVFKLDGIDVREARLSCMPDGRLLVTLAAGIFKDKQYTFLKPYISVSDKNEEIFSPMENVNISSGIKPGIDWIWRVTWYNRVGYGVLYQSFPENRGGEWVAHLVKTTDGKYYENVTQLNVEGRPNESTIRFDKDGKMYVMIRREGDDRMGYLGVSNYPYTQWAFNKLFWRLGGPNFLFLNNKQLVMGSRYTEEGKVSTALFISDLNGAVKKIVKLPSGGDNGYPGMVIHKKILWVMYYSSHEGKASIYLAKVPLKLLLMND